MNLKTAAIFLALMIFIPHTTHASAAEWTTLTSLNGGFTADFPHLPKESAHMVKSANFFLNVHSSSIALTGGNEYAVIWNDYPTDMMAVLTPERVFDGIIKGFASSGEKVLSDKPIKINGNPGHDLEVDVGSGRISRQHLVMAGRRLYQAMVYTRVPVKDDADGTKFLNSFSIQDIQDFPTRGFRLEGATSKDWVPTMRDKSQTVVQWISSDSTMRDVKAFLTIEMGKGTEASTEKTAQGLAQQWKGTVLPDKVVIDGEPAFRISATPTTAGLSPVDSIVVEHHGFLYMIIGATTPGHSCKAQIDAIAKAWKWEDFANPVSQLEFSPDAIPLFGVLGLMNFPKDMYFNPEDPAHVIDLSLFDAQKNYTTFEARGQLMPLPNPDAFGAIKDALINKLNSQKLTNNPLTWNARKDDSSRQVTDISRSADASTALKHDVYTKFALVKLDNEHIVLFNFIIAPADDIEKARYDAAANAMVDSVRLRLLSPATQPAPH